MRLMVCLPDKRMWKEWMGKEWKWVKDGNKVQWFFDCLGWAKVKRKWKKIKMYI